MTKELFPGKQFISTVLDMLDDKDQMTKHVWNRYVMRAAMAGIIVGILYMAYHATVAAFEAIPVGEDKALYPLGKWVGSWVFGPALALIYYSKSELLTSNMMVVSIGHYYHRISLGKSLKIITLCYLGNFLGGLLIALLAWKSTMITEGMNAALEHTVEAKLGYVHAGLPGWWDLLMRAILCNFMINLAMLIVYSGRIKDDFAKIFIMATAVFLFAFLGFEHSVANTVLFTIVGLRDGIDVAAAAINVIIALIGNFIGGGLLIGLYYAYVNDEASFKRRHPEYQRKSDADMDAHA